MCGVGWDRKDANVACRSLGFGSAVSYRNYYYHPNFTREFKISNVNCTGIENNIIRMRLFNDILKLLLLGKGMFF